MEDMCQTGKVVAVLGGVATVRVLRSDACGHCNACFHLGSNEAEVQLANALGARVGDEVAISLHGGGVVKASALAYGVPLAGLLAGVLVGARFGDLQAAAGGVLLCGVAYLLLRWLEPKFARMRELKPRMISIVKRRENDG
ncbi:MAG: SoxR reducing system RseC family protein [Christensenellaceae bacterium]|jgi:sigma-E factor negative regulatory protein RseC|nr:SoxR reducing system RseC family protein [Christensenellaceae bacterium]